MATDVRVFEISKSNASVLANNQICSETTTNTVTNFKMWAGKDDAGNITRWLALDQNARVNDLTINGNNLLDSTGNVMTFASQVVTFDNFPITPSTAPDADYETANKKYVDDNLTGGDTGVQGETGVGAQGIQGETGVQGIQGQTGVAGIQGQTGVQGLTGVAGIQGQTGVAGIQGATGVQVATFLNLTDTIGSYNANRILFESGVAVVDSSSLTWDASTLYVGGNVGIGTTDPTTVASGTLAGTILNVKEASTQSHLVSQGLQGALLHLVDLGGNEDDKWLSFLVDSGIGKFFTVADDGLSTITDNILIMDLGTGRVGIGTDTPGSSLEVVDATLSEVFLEKTGGKITSIGVGNDGGFIGYDSTGFLEFATITGNSAADYSAKARLDSDGNFGLGTTTPLLNVGSAAGDFAGDGFHIKSDVASSQQALLIIEGDSNISNSFTNPAGQLIFADNAEGADDKIFSVRHYFSRLIFRGLDDDLATTNPVVMALDGDTGNVSFGSDTPNGPIDFDNLASSTQLVLEEVEDTTNEGGTVAAILKVTYNNGGGATVGYMNIRATPA